MYFLVHKSNRKSINLGTLPVFDFCHETPCDKHPYLFPDLFCLFLFLLSCFPEYDLRRGTSLSFDDTLYHCHILCMCVFKLISRNGLNQYCSIQTISHGSPPCVGGTLCGRKNVLFSTQSKTKSVNLGPCQFVIFVTKHLVANIPIYFPTSFVFSSS